MFYISKKAAVDYVKSHLEECGYTDVVIGRTESYSDYGVAHVDVHFMCVTPVYDDDAEDYKAEHITGLFTVWSDPKNYWSVNGLYGEW